MLPIIALVALALVAALWTAHAVLGAIVTWLVRHSDRTGAAAPATNSFQSHALHAEPGATATQT